MSHYADPSLLDRVENAFSSLQFDLEETEASFRLSRVNEPPKPAIRVSADTHLVLTELVVWATGEADLTIGDARSGEILINEHREITGEVGIRDAIETLRAYLLSETEADLEKPE